MANFEELQKYYPVDFVPGEESRTAEAISQEEMNDIFGFEQWINADDIHALPQTTLAERQYKEQCFRERGNEIKRHADLFDAETRELEKLKK